VCARTQAADLQDWARNRQDYELFYVPETVNSRGGMDGSIRRRWARCCPSLFCRCDVRNGSWLCENPSAGRSDARLIQTECLSRMNDSPGSQVRFFSCPRSTAPNVFAQPGSISAVASYAEHVGEWAQSRHGTSPADALGWVRRRTEMHGSHRSILHHSFEASQRDQGHEARASGVTTDRRPGLHCWSNADCRRNHTWVRESTFRFL
jgi:hypothetical protein